jgi:Domain of unknown function (DUF4258)
MERLKITNHARQRLQQRGARQKELMIVIAYGDIEVPARDGCRFLRLSRRAVASLLQSGRMAVHDVDRAKRVMVLADQSDRIVTVFKCDPERRISRSNTRRGR